MNNQLTSNAEALRLFFTEDIYLVKSNEQMPLVEPVTLKVEQATNEVISLPKEILLTDVADEVVNLIVEEPKPEIKKVFDFKYLGKNQKNILILVNDKENEVSTEQGRELLRKLVNAIGLTAKDFALLNYANYTNALYDDLFSFFTSELILAFGVDAKQLGIAESPLHQLAQHGKSRIVFTTNLHDLDADQASKKVLWTSLQQIK
ncbi:hypothetical protein FA048_00410 [Pedobacter polaris]|uniref:Uncharacterized protein n=1 Tax=Pedobacter polaris TaxID=2571273 RepID=A0A4U1CVB2_9SPHI|nr:hypothetical protein [Pedobacter polaris]TKC12115.1 hypothetical protein FA048_00410 [Pedobacter polaris]